MKVLIVGNGSINDYEYMKRYTEGAELAVFCDGGLRHASGLSVFPHVIIGDFDSVSHSLLSEYKQKNVEVLTFPTKKDKTDMEICLDYAKEKGATEVVILGGMGTRFDHTLANVHLLYAAKLMGIDALLANEFNEITVVTDKKSVQGKKGDIVSLVPLTPVVSGVSISGFEYGLKNATITLGQTIGVSNVIKDRTTSITIASGALLVIKSRESVEE